MKTGLYADPSLAAYGLGRERTPEDVSAMERERIPAVRDRVIARGIKTVPALRARREIVVPQGTRRRLFLQSGATPESAGAMIPRSRSSAASGVTGRPTTVLQEPSIRAVRKAPKP